MTVVVARITAATAARNIKYSTHSTTSEFRSTTTREDPQLSSLGGRQGWERGEKMPRN